MNSSPRLEPYLAEPGEPGFAIQLFSLSSFATLGYVSAYDPDIMWPNGVEMAGCVDITPVKEDALLFRDLAAAFRVLRMQSEKVPMRPDGKPNRPLTAFSCTFVAAAKS